MKQVLNECRNDPAFTTEVSSRLQTAMNNSETMRLVAHNIYTQNVANFRSNNPGAPITPEMNSAFRFVGMV